MRQGSEAAIIRWLMIFGQGIYFLNGGFAIFTICRSVCYLTGIIIAVPQQIGLWLVGYTKQVKGVIADLPFDIIIMSAMKLDFTINTFVIPGASVVWEMKRSLDLYELVFGVILMIDPVDH